MSLIQEVSETTRSPRRKTRIASPEVSQGGDIWQIAKRSTELDLNSSYMYLLFARDFASTSRVALIDDEVAGFVLAYRRTEDPECLFVWQVAVDERFRGEGLATRMLDDLVGAPDGAPDGAAAFRKLETTITDDNLASQRLFRRVAERWGTQITSCALFDESHFPDDHEAERLYEIGPITQAAVHH